MHGRRLTDQQRSQQQRAYDSFLNRPFLCEAPVYHLNRLASFKRRLIKSARYGAWPMAVVSQISSAPNSDAPMIHP